MAEAESLSVRVHAIVYETDLIRTYELRDPNGSELPPFSAGSHVDLKLANGLNRSYSLFGSQADRRRYLIAVALDPNSRGGSVWIHNNVSVGDILEISAPRNHFGLHEDAPRSLIIAGGIGITPLLAMIHRMEEIHQPWELHYSSRSRAHAAFLELLSAPFKSGEVFLHHSSEGPEFLDLRGIVEKATPGTHAYCCGPTAMLDAFVAASEGQPEGTVHIERFAGTATAAAGGFDIILAKSGKTYRVASNETILDRLDKEGIAVPNSCREGVCGACETRLLAGEADHRDLIQTDPEKKANRSIFLCCSGSVSESLTLDL